MSDKIKVVPSTMPRVQVVPSTMPRIDHKEVARALGAEIVERPRILVSNSDEMRAKLQHKEPSEHQLSLEEADWEKLCALAKEFKEGDKTPSPERVALVLLRRALQEQLEGKAQMKAQLYEPQAQAGE